MATVGDAEERIAEVEGFRVAFRHRNGNTRKVRADKQGVPVYNFRNAASGTWTVQEWLDKRFYRLYPDFDTAVYTSSGAKVTHRQTQLRTVRRI